MKRGFFLIFIIFSIAIYGYEDYNDVSVEINTKYIKLDSRINPDNIFNMNKDLNSELGLYYKKNIYFDSLTLNFSDYVQYSINENELENKVLEMYSSVEIFGNYLDVGKKKNVKSVSFVRKLLDFSNIEYTKNRYTREKYDEGKVQINYEIFTLPGVIGLTYYPKTDFSEEFIKNISSNQSEMGELRFVGFTSNLEYTLLAAKDEILRIGGNLSTTVGNNLEIHCETAYLEKKERYDIIKKDITNDIFQTEVKKFEEKDGIQFIIGTHFTKSDYSIIAEYYYNNYGLSSDEWDKKLELIKDSRDLYDDRNDYNIPNIPTNEISRGNLGNSLNFISNNRVGDMCKHYLMSRVSNSSLNDLDLSAITLVNMQDYSGMLILNADYLKFDKFSINVTPQLMFGNEYSEYRLIGESRSISVNVEYRY